MARLPGLPYRVFSSYDLQELRRDVNDAIEHGYEPQGGIQVSGDSNRGEAIYFQAVYRPSTLPHGYYVDDKKNEKMNVIDKPNRHLVPFIDEEFEGAVGKPSDDISKGKKK